MVFFFASKQGVQTINPNMRLGKNEKKYLLDIDKKTRTGNGDRGVLDFDNLLRIIAGEIREDDSDGIGPVPVMAAQARTFLSYLEQMHEGVFFEGLKSGNSIYDRPLNATFDNQTFGQSWGFVPVLLWFMVWPAYLLFGKQPSYRQGLTPRKTFSISFVAIVALDLVLIFFVNGISLEKISGAKDLLMDLLNLSGMGFFEFNSYPVAGVWGMLLPISPIFVPTFISIWIFLRSGEIKKCTATK